MTIHRFFIAKHLLETAEVALPENVSHQIRNVLRLEEGTKIMLLDNEGHEYLTSIRAMTKTQVIGQILEKKLNQNEPATKICLYMSSINNDKLELAIQKCTEAGVFSIIPIQTEHTQYSITKIDQHKLERFNKIAQEAAEQSERGIIPTIETPIKFSQALEKAKNQGPVLLAAERTNQNDIFQTLTGLDSNQVISIFIGPEGGFSDREIEQAKSYGATLVSLGPRILRAETAAIVASFVLANLRH